MSYKKNIYSAFEINILSKSLKLPELQLSTKKNFSVEIIKKKIKNPDESVEFNFRYNNLLIRENKLILKVPGVGDFEISDGRKIYWHNAIENYLEHEIRSYLLGSVIGALLIQRENLVLHANALTNDKKTIVCIGDTGRGKSTLAYSLMKKGWKLLSDDLVAVTNTFKVLPGIPRIKLWQDAINYYGIDKNNLTKVRSDMEKFQLSGDQILSAYNKSRVSSIYILEDHCNIKIKEEIIQEKEKFFELFKHIYRPIYVNGLNKKIHYFKKISELIKKVPIYKLSLPRSLSNMEKWINLNEMNL